jgi:hypothetical protein
MIAAASMVVGQSQSQSHVSDETKAEVPALGDFHTTIYQLWHTAWPEKDVKMMQSLWPDIEVGYKKVKEAKLPGILRDKQAVWDKAVGEFGKTVKEYQKTMNGSDTDALLKAAEKLHAQFEGLVRIVKPVLKEVDAFHQVLYMLYHYYSPEYNVKKIKESVAELEKKMDLLNKAALPEKHKSKEEKFNKTRKELSESVKSLASIVAANKDKKEVVEAIDKMHSNYETLEKVFD